MGKVLKGLYLFGNPHVGNSEVKKMYVGTDKVFPPYDAEIEYLESTGTQYIQLPLSVYKSSYFEVSGYFIPRNGTTFYGVMGANPYEQFSCEWYSSTNGYIMYTSRFGGQAGNGGWGGYENVVTKFFISTEKIFSPTTETFIDNVRPLTGDINGFRVFGLYRNVALAPIAFCSVKIVVGKKTVYDLIPVRVGTTGYMYDKVSRQLFGNAGTGDFVLGNDVV